MRLAVLLVLVVLAAGCSSPGADPTPVTSTPDATPTGTPTATPEPTQEPTPTPTATPPTTTPTTTTPAPNATVPVNITIRHDYSNASENLTFVIPPNAEGNLTIEIQFDTAPSAVPGQFVCSPGLRVKVIRPDGSLHHDKISSAGSGPNTHCGAVSASAGSYPTDVPPGEWRAAFEGNGVGIGWVRVFAPES